MRDSICNDCAKRTRCDMAEIGRSPLAISTCYGYEKGNPTNADNLRAMSDEELAEFLWGVWRHKDPLYKECVDGWAVPFYHWLKQEVSNG